MPDSTLIVSTTDYFVTENTLDSKCTPEDIVRIVRDWKTTGEVTIKYTTVHGGIRTVTVVERLKLNDERSDDVRNALGMVASPE